MLNLALGLGIWSLQFSPVQFKFLDLPSTWKHGHFAWLLLMVERKTLLLFRFVRIRHSVQCEMQPLSSMQLLQQGGRHHFVSTSEGGKVN